MWGWEGHVTSQRKRNTSACTPGIALMWKVFESASHNLLDLALWLMRKPYWRCWFNALILVNSTNSHF
jgi:hypothetical protein